MFCIPPFRYAIMSVDDKKKINTHKATFFNEFFDDNLLHQLQKTYTFLQFSEKQAYNPKYFCSAYKDMDGAPINPKVQQDSQEFFNTLCDKIEQSLRDTKFKYIIENIFTGKTCSSVICEQCKTVSNRFEDFYNLSLEIKNINNLYESLNKFIESEKIENFKCEVCNKRVNISKRTSLSKLPNVLFIHLKRFNMNYETQITEKINSKFEFPNTLNLKNYCAEEIYKNKETGEPYETFDIYPKEDEYYEYELKGINVHLGNAQVGHYLSFIDVERDGKDNEPNVKSSVENNVIKSKWLKFNDSIVSNFDVKEIPNESYGGYIDNNKNENIQSAYLLIYEKKKKYPMKIKLDNEKVKHSNYAKENIIEYDNSTELETQKLYNISYINNKEELKKKKIYDLIFYNKDKKEYYSYLPYYNIEKLVGKNNLVEVMNKNQKFFNRKEELKSTKNYNEKCNELLLKIIDLKEFNIANTQYDQFDKIKLIDFFKEQVNNMVPYIKLIQELKENILPRTELLFKKIILPIINDTKIPEYEQLSKKILDIILENDFFSYFFEIKSNSSYIFPYNITTIVCDIIYTILKYYDQKGKSIKNYFVKILHYTKIVHENSSLEQKDITEQREDGAYCLTELMSKVIKLKNLDKNELIKNAIIKDLLYRSNSLKNAEIKKVLYEVINYLIELTFDKSVAGKSNMDSSLFDNVESYLKYLKNLFREAPDVYRKLIHLSQFNNQEKSEKFNSETYNQLFDKSDNNDIIHMMDLSFEIINIRDKFSLERYYYIMGIPEMIIIQTQGQNEVKKQLKGNSIPLFGCPLIENGKSEEMYKYVSPIHIYEKNCILARLFPCSLDQKNQILDINNNQMDLSEEDRIKYIYKLICLALLNNGNYCLFKYIYLTPSRYIIKYKNLYEEIIDILSKNKNYDLTEIKKIGEICSKRVEAEIQTVKDNLGEDKIIKGDKNTDKKLPDLPEKMNEKFLEISGIREFTGFIPEHIPDKLVKIIYSKYEHAFQTLIIVDYYTTYKSIEQFREEMKNTNFNNDEDNINIILEEESSDKIKNEIDDLSILKYLIKNNDRINVQILPDMEKSAKLTLTRCLIYHYRDSEIKVKLKCKTPGPNAKYNNYFKDLSINKVITGEFNEIIQIYRKNVDYEFIQFDYFSMNVEEKNNFVMDSFGLDNNGVDLTQYFSN